MKLYDKDGNERPLVREWIIGILFLLLAMRFGFTGLVIAGIAVTMLVSLVSALRQAEYRDEIWPRFLEKVLDNNWIFRMFFWTTAFCFVMLLFNLPSMNLADLNPVKLLADSVKNTVVSAPTDPWANEGWSLIGDGSWFGAFMWYFFLWLPLSYPVSFWDEWKEGRKAKKFDPGKGVGGFVIGIAKVLLGDLFAEGFWKSLGIFK